MCRQKHFHGDEQLRSSSSRKVSLLRHQLEYSALSIRVARRGGIISSTGEADATPSDPLQQDEVAQRAPTVPFHRVGNCGCMRAGTKRRVQQLTNCWCVVSGGRCCAQRRPEDLSGDKSARWLAGGRCSTPMSSSSQPQQLAIRPVSPVLLGVSSEGTSQHAVDTAPGFSVPLSSRNPG